MAATFDGRKILLLVFAVGLAYWLLLPKTNRSPSRTELKRTPTRKTENQLQAEGVSTSRLAKNNEKESKKESSGAAPRESRLREEVLKAHIRDFESDLEIARSRIRNLELELRKSREQVMSTEVDKETSTSKAAFEGHRLVHLDLKGAPPKMDYLLSLIPLVKSLGATGFLVEYEDMFPFEKGLSILRAKNCYTREELKQFLSVAREENLVVIPLIQTFGHLEFVLKHKKFRGIREIPEMTNAVCPLNNQSGEVLKEILKQILDFHKGIKWIHLGGDEVWNLKTCKKCIGSSKSAGDLFLHHMLPLFEYVIKYNKNKIRPIIWDDMMRNWTVTDLKKMANFVDLMVWGYAADLSNYDSFLPGMWERFSEAFQSIWFASSFKGARKPYSNFVPLQQHIDNHQSWLKITEKLKNNVKIQGIALTGWSRFDHYGPMCELLPAAIPSLALCLGILQNGGFSEKLHKHVSERLGFSKPVAIRIPSFKRYIPEEGKYQGHEVYTLVGNLERALGWYGYGKNRVEGWTRPYQQKAKHLSFYHLNVTVTAAEVCMNSLLSMKKSAHSVLTAYFSPETVSEWITDKIVYNYDSAKEMKEKVLKILRSHTFS